jgi:hypothetical protein
MEVVPLSVLCAIRFLNGSTLSELNGTHSIMAEPTPIYRSIFLFDKLLRDLAYEVLAVASVAPEVEDLGVLPFVASLDAYSIYFFMGERCPSDLCTSATAGIILGSLTY